MVSFNVLSKFTAKDAFSSTIAKMGQSTSKFRQKASGAFSAVNQKLNGVNRSANSLLGGLKQLASGLAIGSLIMVAAQGVGEYDKNIQSLQAITGVAGEQFGVFKRNIDDTAKALKISGGEVANVFSVVGSAKAELLDNADALAEVSKQAIILSKAGGMPVEEAADALTNAMNQFAVGADKAAMFTDIFATSQQKGTARIVPLAQAMIKAGGTAKAFGVDFEQTNALLQAFAKGGVVGAEAGTQLSGVLSKLSKSQKKEFNPQFTNAIDVVNNLKKANLSYTALMKLTDAEGAKWLTTLINQNDTVQKLSGNLNVHNNALDQAAVNDNTLVNRMQELKASFISNLTATNNATTGINLLKDTFVFLADNMSSIITIGALLTGSLLTYKAAMLASTIATTAYNVALGIAGVLSGTASIAIGQNTVALTAYKVVSIATTMAIGAWTAAQWLLNAAMNANPIGLIITAVALLVAGVYMLYENWDYVVESVSEFGKKAWTAIKKVGSSILSFLLYPIQKVVEAIAWVTGAEWATKAAADLKSFRDGLTADDTAVKMTVAPEGKMSVFAKQSTIDETSPYVNNTVTSHEQTTQRFETMTEQRATLNINDKTGRASVDQNKTNMPFVLNTAGAF